MNMKKFDSKHTGLITSFDLNRRGGRIVYWILFAGLILFAVTSLFPIVWAILSGFKSVREFNAIPPTIIPQKFEFQPFIELFTVYKIQKYFLNSLYIISGSIFVEFTVVATAGFVLSKIKPIGWKILYTMIMWTLMMPTTMNLVTVFMNMIDLPILHINLMNTFFPMWISTGAGCFHMMLFKNFFDEIPTSYIEAAKIDGASTLQIFYKIILPLSKPIFATVCVFTIMAQWNNFMGPLLYLKNSTMAPVALALKNFSGDMPQPQQLLFSVVMMIPMILVYFISQKFIVTNTINEGEKG